MNKLYIGLDVHKASTSVALAFSGSAEPEHYGKAPSDLNGFMRVLRRIEKKHLLTKEQIRLCYEAGPTGFVLARRLRHLNYDCMVTAPSLIPTRSGDRVKTDRRDARKLAGLLRAGELTAVHIPDADDEIIRDVCRARTDAVAEQTRCRQQLGALLLRNGYHYTGASNWTEEHMRYLRELVLPDPAQKMVLEEYLQRLDASVQQVARIDLQMTQLLEHWNRRPMVEALQGFRGFQQTAAMILVSELGALNRFDHPRQLMAYVGLVPSEDSSGGRRRQGSITKCGNSHARWILIEVAHHYQLPPKVSKELSKRQEKLSREIRDLSWRAQNRLSSRYHHLSRRGLHPNKIKTAIARELLAFIWELAQMMH